jgi:hypothetical protein
MTKKKNKNNSVIDEPNKVKILYDNEAIDALFAEMSKNGEKVLVNTKVEKLLARVEKLESELEIIKDLLARAIKMSKTTTLLKD